MIPIAKNIDARSKRKPMGFEGYHLNGRIPFEWTEALVMYRMVVMVGHDGSGMFYPYSRTL